MTRCAELCLDHNHATLYAKDQGEGELLVFFHGGLADHRAALLSVGELAAELRLLTPDLRAAGRSRGERTLSWPIFADDAAAWIRHLGASGAIVGGVSMGSAVALATALRHPDLVRGLLLVHPVYPGSSAGLADAPREAMVAMDRLGRRVPGEGVQVLFPLLGGLPEAVRDRARAMLAGFDPENIAATTAFLASEAQPFGQPAELGAIRCPTWIVPGSDPSHPAEVAHGLARQIPNARLAPDPLAAARALLAR